MDLPICKNIKKLRQRAGLTQRALASLLQVSVQAVSKWEQERSYPDLTLLPAIASLFGVSIDELFKSEERTHPQKETKEQRSQGERCSFVILSNIIKRSGILSAAHSVSERLSTTVRRCPPSFSI